MSVSSFRFPTAIKFGVGSRGQVVPALKEAGVKRPLVVTDAGVGRLEFFRQLVETWKSDGLAAGIYDDAQGNPKERHVVDGVEAYRQHGADGLILIGGGCALDVGKAIALMVHHPGTLFQYEDEVPGSLPVDQKIPYMIAMPTTSGTGSEVGASSVISMDESHEKKIIYSPRLTPNLVVADPELTVGLSAGITAATGVDALTHNIEAYLAKNYHPICDGIALEGIRLIKRSLRQAVEQPASLEARSDMLMASMMGAIAFQKGLGVVHSCAHALSTYCDMHHGLANAVMLLPCLRFNAARKPERFVSMASGLGLGSGEAGVSKVFQWLEELLLSVGIPQSLTEIGDKVSDRLVDLAFADVCHGNNLVPVAKEDFRSLFQDALDGWAAQS